MAKLIIGSYTTEENAINAINTYELKGHEAKNITLLTNSSQPEKIESKTDVNVSSISDDVEESADLLTKIKRFIINHPNIELDTIEKLVDFGLSKDQAETALRKVQAGKIVVLADDELRMGHETSIEQASSILYSWYSMSIEICLFTSI